MPQQQQQQVAAAKEPRNYSTQRIQTQAQSQQLLLTQVKKPAIQQH
jgi:hypothetical protein